MSDSLLDITLFVPKSSNRHLVFWLLQENAKHYLWIPFSRRTKGRKSSFMQLKASVWKTSKSVVEIADEFEFRGHIQTSRLIYFLHVFDSLANNFPRANTDTFRCSRTVLCILILLSYILTCFKWNITTLGAVDSCYWRCTHGCENRFHFCLFVPKCNSQPFLHFYNFSNNFSVSLQHDYIWYFSWVSRDLTIRRYVPLKLTMAGLPWSNMVAHHQNGDGKVVY